MKTKKETTGNQYSSLSYTTREQVKEAARMLLNAIELYDNENRKIVLRNFKGGNPALSQEAAGSCLVLNKILDGRIEKFNIDYRAVHTGRDNGHWEIDFIFTYKPDAATVLRSFLTGIEQVKRKLHFSDQKGVTDDDGHKYPITGARARLVRELWELEPNESLPGSQCLPDDFKSSSTLTHAVDDINKVFRKGFPPPCDLIENGPNGYYLNRDSFDFSPIKKDGFLNCCS